MGSRWKGKGSEAKALADPMSEIMQQLQYSLIQSETRGLLLGCSVLVEAGPEQANLLNRACFGRPIVTVEKDKLWFQLGLEEAFFLSHSFKCLQIVGEEDKCPKDNEELWEYIKSKRSNFPYFYKAYSHLRTKNWIVRSGSQYGVDFVAYRHHPALVHSDYAVLVLSEDDGYMNGRLRVWSDLHCTIRLCGSVAKTLLILTINKNGYNAVSPSCLRQYNVEERTFTRWSPERCREDWPVIRNGTDDIEAEQANSAIRKCTQVQLMIKNGKKIAASVPNDGCLNSIEENDEELTADFGSKGQAVGRYSGSQVQGCEGITDVSSGSLQREEA